MTMQASDNVRLGQNLTWQYVTNPQHVSSNLLPARRVLQPLVRVGGSAMHTKDW